MFCDSVLEVMILIFPLAARYLLYCPASDPRPWYVLSCLWDDAYKTTLAANRKE